MTILYIVEGEMDAEGMVGLRSDWNHLARANDNVRIDLSRVTRLDPTGLGAILFLFKRLAARKLRVEVVNANGQPKEFLAKLDVEAILSAKSRGASRLNTLLRSFGGRPRAQGGGRAGIEQGV